MNQSSRTTGRRYSSSSKRRGANGTREVEEEEFVSFRCCGLVEEEKFASFRCCGLVEEEVEEREEEEEETED